VSNSIRRWILPLLSALAFLPGIAAATTYYVDPAGSDGAAGGSTTPWKTIGKANQIAQPGDVVMLRPNSAGYTDTPNPASITWAASYNSCSGSRIYFEGSVANPALTLIRNTTRFFTPRVSVHGVTLTNSFAPDSTADCDSLVDAVCRNGLEWTDHREACACRVTFQGNYIQVRGHHGDSVKNSVWMCQFPNLGVGATGVNGNAMIDIGGGGSQNNAGTTTWCDSLIFGFNWFNCYEEPACTDGSHSPVQCYINRHCLWRGNRLNFNAQHLNGNGFVLYERDSSKGNSYLCDTILAVGPGNAQVRFADFGHWTNSCDSLTMDSCFIKLANKGAMEIKAHDRLNHFTAKHSVFAVRSGFAFEALDIKGKFVLDYDTFAGDAGNNNWDIGGIVHIGSGSGSAPAFDDSVLVTNSIFYAFSPAPLTGRNIYPFAPCTYLDGTNSNGGPSCFSYGIHWNLATEDSVLNSGGGISRKNRSNWNLYSMYADNTYTGDRSIRWDSGGTHCSGPGSSNTWFTTTKLDSASVYGTPDFGIAQVASDSTIDYFDPHIGPTSAATGKGNGGTDIGACPFTNFPIFVATPTLLKFDATVASAPQVMIQNAGLATLTVTSVVSSSSKFVVSGAPGSVAASSQSPFTVTFSGNGAASGLITITTNDPKNPVQTVVCTATSQGNNSQSP
jgi:hypothetical protein